VAGYGAVSARYLSRQALQSEGNAADGRSEDMAWPTSSGRCGAMRQPRVQGIEATAQPQPQPSVRVGDEGWEARELVVQAADGQRRCCATVAKPIPDDEGQQRMRFTWWERSVEGGVRRMEWLGRCLKRPVQPIQHG
jgi:hypothetical protein